MSFAVGVVARLLISFTGILCKFIVLTFTSLSGSNIVNGDEGTGKLLPSLGNILRMHVSIYNVPGEEFAGNF